MRLALALLVALPLCGCEMIFKLPTRQGNVIEQKELNQLQVGMTRDQVKFILGTPIAASAFRDERWDYIGYYKNPRGKVYSRTVSLYFDGDNKLARMEGEKPEATSKDQQQDMEALTKEEKKAATEEERDTTTEDKKSGVVIKQKPKQ